MHNHVLCTTRLLHANFTFSILTFCRCNYLVILILLFNYLIVCTIARDVFLPLKVLIKMLIKVLDSLSYDYFDDCAKKISSKSYHETYTVVVVPHTYIIY